MLHHWLHALEEEEEEDDDDDALMESEFGQLAASGAQVKRFPFVLAWACRLLLATMKPSHNTEKRNTRKTAPLWLSRPR